MRILDHRFARIGLIAALIAGAGLAACGRKGNLDTPPSAAISPIEQAAPPPGASEGDQFRRPPQQQAAPAAAPNQTAARKTFFLDWLLN